MRFEVLAVVTMKITVLRFLHYRQVPLCIKVHDVIFQKTIILLGKLGSYPGQVN